MRRGGCHKRFHGEDVGRFVSPGRGLKRPSVPGLMEFITLGWTKGCQDGARKGQREPLWGDLMGSPKKLGLHSGKEESKQ